MILLKSVQANGRDWIQAHQNQPGLPWQGILATQLFSWVEISHHFSATHPMLFFCNTVLQTQVLFHKIFSVELLLFLDIFLARKANCSH